MTSLLPAPKPRFFDKRFWAGSAVGCLVPVLVVVAFMVWVSQMTTSMMGELQDSMVPNAAKVAYDWELVALDGKKVAASELQGKVVFVNVWATWCQPCVAELPSIADLASKFSASKDVVLLCVSGEELSVLTEFAGRDAAPRVPIFRATAGIPKELKTLAIPATFVIDKRGRLRMQHTGSGNWSTAKCVNFLQQLAQEEG